MKYTEDNVSTSLMRAFQRAGWAIVHYHPPGGQASLPIPLETGRHVYLDMVAVRGTQIAILENKRRFSKQDVQKLERILSDRKARRRLIAVVTRFCTRCDLPRTAPYNITAAHGFAGASPDGSHELVSFLRVSHDDYPLLIPARNNPLDLA